MSESLNSEIFNTHFSPKKPKINHAFFSPQFSDSKKKRLRLQSGPFISPITSSSVELNVNREKISKNKSTFEDTQSDTIFTAITQENQNGSITDAAILDIIGPNESREGFSIRLKWTVQECISAFIQSNDSFENSNNYVMMSGEIILDKSLKLSEISIDESYRICSDSKNTQTMLLKEFDF